jgi:predicted glycosyltransferase
MRFLFYSHDGVGLGHVRRHIAIASALAELSPRAKVLLATGVDEVSHLGLPPNIDTLKLPGLRKVANNHYASRRLGVAASDIHALRSRLLQTAVESFRPGVVLVDKHPFGAAGEFQAGLEAARAMGMRAVLGLRDILDEPAVLLKEWTEGGFQDRIADYYDRVLIYGQPSVFDAIEEYRFLPRLSKKARYCGYVLNQTPCAWRSEQCSFLTPPEPVQRPAVLATVGGGEDGFELVQAFIQAATGAAWKGVAVAGPMLPGEEMKNLQHLAAAAGVSLHRFVPCLQELFSSVDAVVCMGGYNTLLEAVCQGVPTVCVPRTWPRSEQLIRARAFERLGLVRIIHPNNLGADELQRQIAAALGTPREQVRQRMAALRVDGAQRAADYLWGLISAESARPSALVQARP